MKKAMVVFAAACVFFLLGSTGSAQDFCEGNFDYDWDQDGTDAFTFKDDFGRSSLRNPCPPDGPAPVPRTGQTTCISAESPWEVIDCADTGQDGDLQKGVAWPNPRFIDNSDGTVFDRLTGLIWLKHANCFGERTWAQALIDCNGLQSRACGLSDGSVAGDWRLANRSELFSLIDAQRSSPALPAGHPFTDVQGTYWSSTNQVTYNWIAWHVSILSGAISYDNKEDSYYVWPVRGGH